MSRALTRALTAVADADDAAEPVPEVERILDSALALFVEVGVKRTTIGDVARRAGIDRVTVYRRVGNKEDLVQAVVTREAAALFEKVAVETRRATTLEGRIERGFATIMGAVRGNAMLARMLVVEEETILVQFTSEGSLLLAGAIRATMNVFEDAVADGLLPSTDGMLPSAEVLVRVAHSLILTPHAMLDLDSERDLVDFASRHLVPMVLGSVPAR